MVNSITVDSDDSQSVLELAGLLEISEFRLFQLAYVSWYGHPPDRHNLEWEFEAYMFYQKVPFWVRHFCRAAMIQARAGQFDPEKFGVHPLSAGRRSLLMAFIYLVVPIIVLLTLLLLGYSSPEIMTDRECILLPCVSDVNRSNE